MPDRTSLISLSAGGVKHLVQFGGWRTGRGCIDRREFGRWDMMRLLLEGECFSRVFGVRTVFVG